MASEVIFSKNDLVSQEIASVASEQKQLVSIQYIESKTSWDSLVSKCPDPHLPQSFAYAEGKAALGWRPRRVLFSCAGQPVAITTLLEWRRFGLRMGVRVNRGPLFLQPDPAPGLVVAVYAAMRRHWGRLWRGSILLIAPALPAGADGQALLRQAGYRLRRDRGWASGRVDLSRSEEDIWRGFDSAFRNRVRNAEKMGARVRVAHDDETFEWMIERHTQNMREKAFVGAEVELLRAMRKVAPEDVQVFQLMLGDDAVAGMSVARFGRAAEYHVGWFGPEGRKLNGGNFLMWQIMRDLKAHGVSMFDVGGMSEGNGYTRFKRTMRPVEYKLAGEWVSF
jgi:CelD/BcsL family acetyltransferase involved in cellulose biosynthesis